MTVGFERDNFTSVLPFFAWVSWICAFSFVFFLSSCCCPKIPHIFGAIFRNQEKKIINFIKDNRQSTRIESHLSFLSFLSPLVRGAKRRKRERENSSHRLTAIEAKEERKSHGERDGGDEGASWIIADFKAETFASRECCHCLPFLVFRSSRARISVVSDSNFGSGDDPVLCFLLGGFLFSLSMLLLLRVSCQQRWCCPGFLSWNECRFEFCHRVLQVKFQD